MSDCTSAGGISVDVKVQGAAMSDCPMAGELVWM
jgi:hypothetical protein